METIEHIVKHPAEKKHKTPILLQHGAWHGAWCWEYWLNYFAELGYEVHAISLPGHGQSSQNKRFLNLYTLGNYTDVLADEIEKLSEPPVVIGHSMGGAILQNYLQHHSLPGAVLLATLPPQGALKMILRNLQKRPRSTLKGFLTMNLYHWVASPASAKSMFLSDNNPIDADVFQQKLGGESLTIGSQTMLPFLRVKKTAVPILVVAAEKDNLFTVAEQKATAQKYNADFILIENQAHDLMIEPAWQSVADHIDSWIQEKEIS
jgi:pimeloyl-ACP methyl ester carboxylesterase